MIEFNESEIVSFFGAVPEPPPKEEQGFFGMPFFVKRVNGLVLKFGLNPRFDALRLTLARDGSDEQILLYRLDQIKLLGIEPEMFGRSWLWVRSRSEQLLRLSVSPSILVEIARGKRAG